MLDSYLTNIEQFPQVPWPDPGTRLSLQRDPTRAYDPRAILVIGRKGEPMGYLPPASSGLLAALMDNGTEADAEVGRSGTLSIFIVLA